MASAIKFLEVMSVAVFHSGLSSSGEHLKFPDSGPKTGALAVAFNAGFIAAMKSGVGVESLVRVSVAVGKVVAGRVAGGMLLVPS